MNAFQVREFNNKLSSLRREAKRRSEAVHAYKCEKKVHQPCVVLFLVLHHRNTPKMAKKKDGRLSQNFGEPGHPARVAKDLFAKKHGARSVSAQTRKLWALFGWSRPDFRIEMLQAEKAKKTHELQLIAAQIRTINDELEKLGVKEA